MADALGLGPSGEIRGGSSPFSRTNSRGTPSQGRRTSQYETNIYLSGSWKVVWQPSSDGFDLIRAMNLLLFAFAKVCRLVSPTGLRSVRSPKECLTAFC
jgi:hypothetical protein